MYLVGVLLTLLYIVGVKSYFIMPAKVLFFRVHRTPQDAYSKIFDKSLDHDYTYKPYL